jgi:hypothetical protein
MKKNNAKKYLETIALAVLGALASSTQAQIVIFSGFSHSYDNPITGSPLVYAQGDAANVSTAYVNGAGAGGSQAVVITTDFTGAGWGEVDYSDRYPSVSGNTSANISDYTLSFDAAVNVANAGFWLVVSTLHNGSPSDVSSFLGISNPNAFEHFSLNLASAFGGGGTLDPLSEWWQLDFNMLTSWGFADPSTGDQLLISNVQLTMVPEPSSLALGALSVMTGLAFLRRRGMRFTHSPGRRPLC